ncbi:hypothetical protein PVAP13_2KG313102 [Panicum virgatum]|uniref:Uncharacterized protein n=1 Tax=Panicum virgatum TaxID=38727 RepID=A0A8T0W4H0_PANVG|nr:hypothetical protein PVAP13_2KG313102 [Panicum virgatum]
MHDVVDASAELGSMHFCCVPVLRRVAFHQTPAQPRRPRRFLSFPPRGGVGGAAHHHRRLAPAWRRQSPSDRASTHRSNR